MTHPNAELFREGYDAFGKGDLDRLRELFSPDITWHSPGSNKYSGDHVGIDAVLGLFGRFNEDTGGNFQTEIHDILANDEHGVALGTLHAARGDKRVDDRYTHVVHVEGGRITESWIFQENLAAIDDLWAD
jgi:uncharacterized protein